MLTWAHARGWGLLALAAWLAAGGLAAVFFAAGGRARPVAAPAAPAPADAAFAWPAPAAPAAADWGVIQRVGAAGRAALTDVARRFRLAGTFFSYESGAGAPERKAIIEDLQQNAQHLLREGDAAGDLTLLRVHTDRVLVRVQDREEELRLSFQHALPEVAAAVSRTNTAAALETTRFGKRVGDNRWVINREAVMQYYDEVRRDPERLLALFDSLKPVYQDKAIAGYVLKMEGEQDFFQAAGLQDGDVVRKVNAINMTSQKRAEWLIQQFIQGRTTALMFDIERNNQPQKLVYFIR